MEDKEMEEKAAMSKGLKGWLWFIFVVNILAAVASLMTVLGAAALSASMGLGAGYTVLCVVSLVLEIVLVAGIAMMLFAQKKLGYYLLCGAAVVGFIVNLITYGMLDALTAANIVQAVLGMVLCPLITFLVAKKDWNNLK